MPHIACCVCTQSAVHIVPVVYMKLISVAVRRCLLLDQNSNIVFSSDEIGVVRRPNPGLATAYKYTMSYLLRAGVFYVHRIVDPQGTCVHNSEVVSTRSNLECTSVRPCPPSWNRLLRRSSRLSAPDFYIRMHATVLFCESRLEDFSITESASNLN